MTYDAKLRRYLGLVLALLLLTLGLPLEQLEQRQITFLGGSRLSILLTEFNFDYKLISAFNTYDRECPALRKYDSQDIPAIYKRCVSPETFYPYIVHDEFSRIIGSSKELSESLGATGTIDDKILAKVTRDYAKSRVVHVKAQFYIAHTIWFVVVLLIFKSREKVGGIMLFIPRALIASGSRLFRVCLRLLRVIHGKI